LTRDELLPSNKNFTGKRLLLAAKEAGAGAMFAALVREWQPEDGSVVIASPIAMPYFDGLPIIVIADDLSDEKLSELLISIRPDSVIVGASVGRSIEKRLYIAAQASGMEVDVFVDHYWNLWQRFADPDAAQPWKYMPNRVYVPAVACAERLVTYGFPQERLRLFNHPLLEPEATKHQECLDSNLRINLQIPEDAVVVLFVSEYLFEIDSQWKWDQPCVEDYVELLSLLLKISARSNSGRPVIILVRPHPGESQSRWDAMCNSISGSQWRNVGNINKDVLFSTTNLVFGLNSMMLMEAVASGLQVYSYHSQLSDRDCWLSTIRTEIVELSNEEECIQIVESIREIKS
jgi:hypothetical protein